MVQACQQEGYSSHLRIGGLTDTPSPKLISPGERLEGERVWMGLGEGLTGQWQGQGGQVRPRGVDPKLFPRPYLPSWCNMNLGSSINGTDLRCIIATARPFPRRPATSRNHLLPLGCRLPACMSQAKHCSCVKEENKKGKKNERDGSRGCVVQCFI